MYFIAKNLTYMIYTDVYALSVHNTVVSNVDICMPGSIVFAALLLSYFLFIFSNGIYIQLVSRNLAFNEFFFFFLNHYQFTSGKFDIACKSLLVRCEREPMPICNS